MRKRYFIKKAFQTKFLMRFALLLGLQAILIGAVFMYISSQTLTSGYYGSQFVVDKTAKFFFMPFLIMSLIVGIFIVVSGMVAFMLLSHRIAGPLYRFEKTLNEIADGILTTRITLRKTDELKELQGAVNAALYKLDTSVKEIKNEVGDMSELVGRSEGEQAKNQMKEILSRIQKKLAFFKTS
jgi:methyl-accepting chemotaxis protein